MDLKDKFIKAYQMLTSHEGVLFVYAFAYALIIGIAPLLIILVVVASSFLLDVQSLIELIGHYIPSELILPFVHYIQDVDASDFVVLISIASLSFWVASRSVYSFLLESSRVDRISIQPFVLRIISVFYFALIILGAFSVTLVLGYLPPYNYITVPLLLWLLMMSFYRLISFKFSRFSEVYMGSAIATAGLILLGKLFFTYINDYSSYQSIYGPLSSVMILLISGFFISYIVYLGFCINVVFYSDEMDDDVIKRKLIFFLSNLNFKKIKQSFNRKSN